MSQQTTALVVSRRVLGESRAFPELLRVHLSQLFGIDWKSPRVKVRNFSRKFSACQTSAAVCLKFSVWYPGSGDLHKQADFQFDADESDSLFFKLVDFDMA